MSQNENPIPDVPSGLASGGELDELHELLESLENNDRHDQKQVSAKRTMPPSNISTADEENDIEEYLGM